MANRKSYRSLMKLDAWVLWDRNGIVGSTRAESACKAWAIFKRYGMKGKVIFR